MNQARLRRGIFNVNLQNLRFCAILAAGWLALGTANLAKAQNGIPCRYEIAHIIQGPPCSNPAGYSFTVGTGISPDGHWVVGYYAQCPTSSVRPFYYNTITSQFSVIPLGPGFYDGQAADVNNDGVVVGTGSRTNVGQRGFVYRISTGEWTEMLPLPGGVYSSATGINSSGVVCGWRSIGPGTNPTTAFYWTAQNGFTDLGLINGQSTSAADINDLNAITGLMVMNNQLHPFLWEQPQVYDLGTLFGYETIPYAINGEHQVVGQSASQPTGTAPHAFRWSAGTISDLGTLPNHQRSRAFGISQNGVVAGISYKSTTPNDQRAVIWYGANITDVNSLLSPGTSVFLDHAVTFDDDQRLLARGFQSNGTVTAFLLQPILGPIGDITGDCHVNVNDLLLVINEWHLANSPADINKDGTVDMSDLLLVIQNWTLN